MFYWKKLLAHPVTHQYFCEFLYAHVTIWNEFPIMIYYFQQCIADISSVKLKIPWSLRALLQ